MNWPAHPSHPGAHWEYDGHGWKLCTCWRKANHNVDIEPEPQSDRYVLAGPEPEGIEAFYFVGTLDEVRKYASLPRSAEWSASIYRLVEVPGEMGPMQGPPEPPGIRVQCPECGRTEWATLGGKSTFDLIKLAVHWGPHQRHSYMLICPCGTGIEVEFE